MVLATAVDMAEEATDQAVADMALVMVAAPQELRVCPFIMPVDPLNVPFITTLRFPDKFPIMVAATMDGVEAVLADIMDTMAD